MCCCFFSKISLQSIVKNIPEKKLFLVEQERGEGNEEEAMEKLALTMKDVGRNVGIACSLDYLACSAYRVTRKMGWKIPEDAGITGYNNNPWVRVFDPPLTSISIQEEEIGKETALAIIKNRRMSKIIEPVLFERGSTERR